MHPTGPDLNHFSASTTCFSRRPFAGCRQVAGKVDLSGKVWPCRAERARWLALLSARWNLAWYVARLTWLVDYHTMAIGDGATLPGLWTSCDVRDMTAWVRFTLAITEGPHQPRLHWSLVLSSRTYSLEQYWLDLTWLDSSHVHVNVLGHTPTPYLVCWELPPPPLPR